MRVLPFLRWWPLVNRETTRADLTAGLTGAILGLPQGVAFAILAGLPPEYGLYAAMVPPALSALFGSSFQMVAGPTNAVAILLFASLTSMAAAGSPEYIRLVLTVTLLTGVFELAMGLADSAASSISSRTPSSSAFRPAPRRSSPHRRSGASSASRSPRRHPSSKRCGSSRCRSVKSTRG